MCKKGAFWQTTAEVKEKSAPKGQQLLMGKRSYFAANAEIEVNFLFE